MSANSHLPAQSSVPLTYTIAQCSAHSGRYVSENIMVDSPMDQASRWSGASQGTTKQWILLRLESLSVVKSITFGKFHKPHPCNMKEFKLYVGITDDHMTEVLHYSVLKNDPIAETFLIKHTNSAGVSFPTRFVKIVPLSAHGHSFHTSIWYVSLMGITNEPFVNQVRVNYDEYRETAVLRHLLKHLRQRRLLTPYQSILARSGLQLEHPLVTELHSSMVLQGNWSHTEQLVHHVSQAGLFDAYLHSCQPHAVWKRLYGTDADGDVPSHRGGHAMCIDHANGVIYLLGGWDGQKSLDDFWVYDIKGDKWRILSHSTSTEKNGPGARSCHKIVFDAKTGCIYLLGRLSDADALKPRGSDGAATGANTAGSSRQAQGAGAGEGSASATTAFCSEFYRYHTRGLDSGKWDFLTFDTASSGGPPLIFDHQMVMDSDAQILYVFGGRVVDGDWDSVKYSGLYSYNVRLSKWRILQHADTSNSSHVPIPSRFGHSMVFEPSSRTLFIFAGQRDDKYLSDLYAYDIATNTATELYSNFTTSGGPHPCFTQRAVIDPNLREIYVFCGLTRSQQAGSTTTLPSVSPNWVYRYDTRPGKWTQILPEPEESNHHKTGKGKRPAEEPLPRYAHQVVYDPNTKTVFMHGGNAGIVGAMERSGSKNHGEDADGEGAAGVIDVDGREGGKEKRLDDFWSMTLRRPAPDEIIRRAKYQIRQQQFREMCEELPPVKALNFLQTDVSSVVDHSDPAETEMFRSLLTHLLSPPPPSSPLPHPKTAIPVTDADDYPPPRKRSRPNTPDESWTNILEDEEVTTDEQESVGPVRSIRAHTLKAVEDPEELKLRDEAQPGVLSAARFTQRNEVFESLLKFVAEEEKQPAGSLLDMVDGDEGGL